jgi:hypothetical protein
MRLLANENAAVRFNSGALLRNMAELLRGLTTIRVASARGRVSAAAVETDGALHRPLKHRPCQAGKARWREIRALVSFPEQPANSARGGAPAGVGGPG